MYYLNSRFYDAEIGRFINADGEISGVGGELLGNNMYTYCFNNPVNWDDSDGNWPKLSTIFTGIAVAAVAVAMVAVCVATAPVIAGVGVAGGNVSGFKGKMNNIINIFGGTAESELLNLMGR